MQQGTEGSGFIALVWGPKDLNHPDLGYHMYFAPYGEYYEGVYRRKSLKQEIIYPTHCEIPLGTILKFNSIGVRWHSDEGVGSNGFVEKERTNFVIYSMREDGVIGLLLPEMNMTLNYILPGGETRETTENYPFSFLPFPGQGAGEPRVDDGICKILSYPYPTQQS